MNIQLLDAIFLLFFSQQVPGAEITLYHIHTEYDYKNRGILTKEELEYVINKQITLKKLKPISVTQFEVGNFSRELPTYEITNQEYENSVKNYYEKHNFKPHPHPLWKK